MLASRQLFMLLCVFCISIASSLSESLQIPTTERRFDLDDLYWVNLHKASNFFSEKQCAGSTIIHRATARCQGNLGMRVIPHSAMYHDGVKCGTGAKAEYTLLVPAEAINTAQTAAINRLLSLYKILAVNERAHNAFQVLNDLEPVYLGFEFTAPRKCGPFTFPLHTVYIYLIPAFERRDINFGFAYLRRGEVGMVSFRPDQELCLYKQTRVLGPGQPPYATPTPSPKPTDLNFQHSIFNFDNPQGLPICFPAHGIQVVAPTPSVTPSTSHIPPTPSAGISPSASRTPLPSHSATPSMSPKISPNTVNVPSPPPLPSRPPKDDNKTNASPGASATASSKPGKGNPPPAVTAFVTISATPSLRPSTTHTTAVSPSPSSSQNVSTSSSPPRPIGVPTPTPSPSTGAVVPSPSPSLSASPSTRSSQGPTVPASASPSIGSSKTPAVSPSPSKSRGNPGTVESSMSPSETAAPSTTSPTSPTAPTSTSSPSASASSQARSASPSPTGAVRVRVCFPRDATVQLQSGRVIPMHRLRIGHWVLVRHGHYSAVMAFTHSDADAWTPFVRLQVSNGLTLTLSESHYVPVGRQQHLKAARNVQVGDRLTVGNGSMDAVTQKWTSWKRGLYNPQTIDGSIVVDGLLASTFTQAVNPASASALLAPVKFLFRFGIPFPMLSTWLAHGTGKLPSCLLNMISRGSV